MEVLVKEGLRRRVRPNRYDDGEETVPPRLRELKWYTGQSSGSTVNSALLGVPGPFTDWDTVTNVLTPTTHMLVVAQGVDYNQRIGNVIDLDSIDMNVTFQAGTSNFDARFWLVWQKENCLTIPSSPQIFFSPDTIAFNLNGVMCLMNPMLEDIGFELLYEYHLNSSMDGHYSFNGGQLQHDFSVNLKGLQSSFVPGFNFPANGALRFYVASRCIAGGGNPTFAAVYQLKYRDAQ